MSKMNNCSKNKKRRSYKKANKRNNKFLRVSLLSSFVILSILIFVLSYNTNANTVDGKEPVYKYFTSYQIDKGDTLWTIVVKFNPTFSYKEVMKTVDEIRDINHLGAFEKITAGEHLVVPYYSTEYK